VPPTGRKLLDEDAHSADSHAHRAVRVAPDVIERERTRAVHRANAGVSLGTKFASDKAWTEARTVAPMPQERVVSPEAKGSQRWSACRVGGATGWSDEADGAISQIPASASLAQTPDTHSP